jgi:hypothetical protein
MYGNRSLIHVLFIPIIRGLFTLPRLTFDIFDDGHDVLGLLREPVKSSSVGSQDLEILRLHDPPWCIIQSAKE